MWRSSFRSHNATSKLDKNEAKNLTIELFKKVQLPTPKIFSTYPHQISEDKNKVQCYQGEL